MDEEEVTKKVVKKVVMKMTYKGEEFKMGTTERIVDEIDDYCTAINGLIDGLAIKINEIIDYVKGEEETDPDKWWAIAGLMQLKEAITMSALTKTSLELETPDNFIKALDQGIEIIRKQEAEITKLKAKVEISKLKTKRKEKK